MNRVKSFLGLLLLTMVGAEPRLTFDKSRARPLEAWKQAITGYSSRHYGEARWQLEPRCIVLHYTAGTSFPWNLVREQSFAGEAPGLASHFVVDGSHIYQLLPTDVRSRGAFGINHRAINIEMVGADQHDLMSQRRQTMDTTADLVVELLQDLHLSAREVYSHEQVSKMDTDLVPWVLDHVNPEPYHKIDPGQGPMEYIMSRVRKRLP